MRPPRVATPLPSPLQSARADESDVDRVFENSLKAMAYENASLLSDEELNRLIAEKCGWTVWNGEYLGGWESWQYLCRHIAPDGTSYVGPRPKGTQPYPYYTASLDAMAVAIQSLTEGQKDKYRSILALPHAGPRGSGEWYEGYDKAIDATAKQRAIAFVMVIQP